MNVVSLKMAICVQSHIESKKHHTEISQNKNIFSQNIHTSPVVVIMTGDVPH